ncbi:MAG: CDP-alcohol phosphatidyltransferase family protein [Vallitaleaceae bacterium]|jgi:archaetidylinositol phosphate synthase|nr:CDP-alcohol phosphatidyltransferase family protein [Vallitaleaceae bacterium]
MLDTHGRKYVQPILNKLGKQLVRGGISPIAITFIALGFGFISIFFIWMNQYILAVVSLWVSGLFDVLDGTVARLTKMSSDLGAFLDVTFDRIVELGIIIMLAYQYPEISTSFVVLTGSIVLSLTIFLTVGGFAKNHSEKSFYYQAGIAERTEGFIFFTLMLLLPDYMVVVVYIFAGLIIITSIQRFIEGIRLLRD